MDAKLPRAIHAGIALGPDPGVPEAKAMLPKGIARLFHGAGGASGGGGGGKPRVGQAVRAPPTVAEPATGLPLPSVLGDLPSHDPAKSPISPALKLLGCGVRVKKLGFVSIQVYAVGVYASAEGCKEHLKV